MKFGIFPGHGIRIVSGMNALQPHMRGFEMKKLGIAIFLIISVVPGLSMEIDSVGKKPPQYRWMEMVWPLQTITFSFPLESPLVFKRLGLEEHITIGYLTYFKEGGEYSEDSSDPDFGERSFGLLYSVLEWHKLLVEKKQLRVSLLAGGGLGYYTLWVPLKPDGIGYILSSGMQVQVGRLVGDVRLNFGRATPQLFPTINIGYQGKTLVGAMVGPAIVIFVAFMAVGGI